MVAIDLSGRVALVTGSSSGLGAATAERLAEAGAGVLVNGWSHPERAEGVAERIRRRGGRAAAVRADVRDPDAVGAMVAGAEAAFGAPVTVVVNNVGHEERCAGPLDLDWSDYQLMLDLNLRASFHTCRAAVPAMRRAGWGRIVNVLTVAMLRPSAGFAAYSSAKSALWAFSRHLALDLGPEGITCNMVAPGWIETDRSAGTTREAVAAHVRGTPLRRWGQPEDVADVVLFFCSPLARFVTGDMLTVCGGTHMH